MDGRTVGRARAISRAVLLALLSIPLSGLVGGSATAQSLDPDVVTLSVPGSALRCGEIEVVMDSSLPSGHESARINTTGLRILYYYSEKCGWGPGPCYCWGSCWSVGEWNPAIGYRGPIHFGFEVTGTTTATYYVSWDDGNVGPPYYRTKTYTTDIQTSGSAAVIVINASPKEIPADGASTSTVTVKVKDRTCKPIPNVGVSLTTDKGSFAGGGASTTVTTNSAGVATATLVAAASPGTATVTAGAFGAYESTPVEMKGCELTLSPNPQVIRADPRAVSAITATLKDGSGAGMSGQTVTMTTNFSTLSGGGSSGATIDLTTNSSGLAGATLQGVAIPQRADITASAACGATASTFVVLSADEDASLGPDLDVPYIADPVHPAIGNYTFAKRLFSLPGKGLPLDFTVYYNSRAAASNGPLGYGWRHSYDTKLVVATDEVAVHWGSGRVDRFLGDGGTYTSLAPHAEAKLSKPDALSYEVRLTKSLTRYRFDASGRLLSITDSSGNAVTLSHSSRLDRITDSAGRQVQLTYAGGLVTSIAGPAGSGVTAAFGYDAGNLTAITDPRGATWRFGYASGHLLQAFTDANGNIVLSNTYDAGGRVTSQADAFGHVTSFVRTAEPTGTAVTVTLPDGRQVVHHYDFAFNPIAVTDGRGGTARFAYDGRQRRTSIEDKNDRPVQFQYDADDNITAVTDPLGDVTSFAYDAQRRVTSAVDPLSRTTAYAWDAQGRLTSIREPAGQTASVTYDAHGLPATTRGFDGATWTYARDAQGLVTSETDPRGRVTTFAHDGAGRISQVSYPEGAVVRFAYDAGGLLTSSTDPLGHVTAYGHDANGNTTAITFEPLAATTRVTYDAANRPVSVTDALGGVERYTYDSVGNLRTVTDADGVRTTFEYDEAYRLIAEIDGLGTRTEYIYDASGNPTGQRDALGRTWRTLLDAATQPTANVDPLGGRSEFQWDALGRNTSVRDPSGRTSTTAYDLAGWPVTSTLPDGTTLRTTFDAAGRLATFTDGGGRVWQFTRDAAGHVTAMTDPAQRAATFTHDGLGRVTRTRTRAGREIVASYDAGSRVTRAVADGAGPTDFEYDAAGNLTRAHGPAGATVMTYDVLGRMLTLTDPRGPAMAFAYTAAGRLATLTYPGNRPVTYRYDEAGRLTAITDWLQHVTRFGYDASGAVTRVSLPNGTRTDYAYDGAGRLVTLTHRRGDGGVLRRVALTLDAAGRVLQSQRVGGAASSGVLASASHAYDAANRLLSSTRGGETTTFVSDLDGSIVESTSGAVATAFTYDAYSRLTGVTMAGRTTSYTYDGRGLRIAASTNGTTTGYLRDADGVYGLLDGAGAVTRYLIGTGQLLYSIGAAAGDVLVYHGDERGSVVAVTDGTGQEVQSYLYGPYGEVLAAQGTLPNPFQYLGQHWVMTDANGLLHMNARYYLPEARRFLTEDPIGLGGGPNVLAYAAGDPVNQIDPSGLDFVIPPGWHPEVAKAAEKFVTKGIELGLRELGYFHPTGGVVVDGIKISTTEWAEYTALNANQLMRQNSLDYTAHWGQTGGTPSNPVKGYQFKPRLPQAPVKGYQFKPRLPQAPVKGYQFKPRLPQAPVKGYQFKPRLPQASVPKPPGGPKVPTGLLGRVGRWAGPVGMVIAAGLEGWHTGRKLGQSSLVWDGNQGRWITLDEGHQWIYNQYNGWVDQPEMFDYIDPVAYANWKSKAFGDGTGGGTKGDGTSLPGVGSGGAR